MLGGAPLEAPLPRGALLGREATHEPQGRLTAPTAPESRPPVLDVLCRGLARLIGERRSPEQELESPQGRAMGRVQHPEGTHAVKALGGHVLQEASQELLRRERHGATPGLSTRAVAERDRVVVACDDRLAGQTRAVDPSPAVVGSRGARTLLQKAHRGRPSTHATALADSFATSAEVWAAHQRRCAMRPGTCCIQPVTNPIRHPACQTYRERRT